MARSSRALLGVALGAVAFSAIVACNSLIGLDDFQKGQCPGARCDAGTEPDVFVPTEAGPDATLEGGKGADPVSWARWKMPNYDAGADAGLIPLTYTVRADEVDDGITGLTWRRALVDGDFTVSEGAAACTKLNANGEVWRLPKRIELVTLLDFGRPTHPFINEVFPVASFGFRVWTSSEVRPYTGGPDQAYWAVNFDTGAVENQAGNIKAKVLCVRVK